MSNFEYLNSHFPICLLLAEWVTALFLGCVGTDGPGRAAQRLQGPRRAGVPIICLVGWSGKAKIHLHIVAVYQFATKIQNDHRMTYCI